MSVQHLSDLSDPEKCRRLVIKIGSALLVGSDGSPRREWVEDMTVEIAAMRARGQDVVIVSSGAIALGAARLGLEKGGRKNLADAQAAASVGQIALAGLWSELLGRQGLEAAQILLTLQDMEERRRYLNAASTLARLLSAGAVPVVNENDSVATEEIRFGDNDRLAARVAQASRADAVVLLSDIDGLFDRNPADRNAQLLTEVRGVTPRIRAMATDGSSSGMGSGGMVSKLQAAEIAERAGIAMLILNGTHHQPVRHALDTGRGTVFIPRRSDGARKAWLGGRLRLKGQLQVDAGCASALRNGRSLLAAGMTKVGGSFHRGDAVAICESDGTVIAHGLVEYDAQECTRLIGLQSGNHAEVLGYAPRPAIVHRNHMVLL
ncbi:MAG: glutamate 5-kinase [Sphingomonadaceae bacterium]